MITTTCPVQRADAHTCDGAGAFAPCQSTIIPPPAPSPRAPAWHARRLVAPGMYVPMAASAAVVQPQPTINRLNYGHALLTIRAADDRLILLICHGRRIPRAGGSCPSSLVTRGTNSDGTRMVRDGSLWPNSPAMFG